MTLRPAAAVDIDIVRDRQVTITFDDDVVAVYPVKALRAGFRVMDVPITTDARQGGVSAIHVVRDGGRILRDVTRFRFSR
jgi:chorismate mutase